MSASPFELWQTEWCPASHRVRQRLTELGLTYTVHQVPVRAEARAQLRAATGASEIPVLVVDGSIVSGEPAILAYLNEHYIEPTGRRRATRQSGQGKAKGTGGSMSQVGSTYTVSRSTDLSFTEAVARVREQLAADGFGVLCEIDVQATLKQKLDVDREPYLILGACNPALAHRALEAEPELGVLLPCNVVIYQEDGQTRIAAVDAEQMLSIVGNDELAPTATGSGVASPLSSSAQRANDLRPDRLPAASANLEFIATARSPIRFRGFVRMTSSFCELKMCL